MATRYQDISYGQFGGGIDALSPESKIPDGFVEYLRNIDPTPEGSLEKRKGYQLYGSVPTRVQRISYSQDETNPAKGDLCFYLDESVNVLNLKSSPILVYGHTSECHQAGDWSDTDRYNYYPSFTVDVRRTIPAGTTQTEVLEGAVHKQGSDLEIITVQATTATTTSNLQLIDNVSINSTNGDVSATFSNYQAKDLNIFLLAKSREAQAGTCYIKQVTVANGATVNTQIAATEHNLNSFDVNTVTYQVVGGQYEQVTPNSISIDPTGAVSIAVTNNTGSSQTYRFLLFSPEDALSTQWTVPGDNQLVQPISVTGDFPLFQLYEMLGNGTRNRIWPESIEIDSVTKKAYITINNEGNANSLDIRCYWDYAPLVSNRLCVEASNPSASTTTLTVPASQHLLGKYLSIQASESLNVLGTDNRQVLSDVSRVKLTDNSVEVSLTNNLSTSFQAWIQLKARNSVTGSCYHYSVTVPTGTHTFTISQATHGISSTLLGLDFYKQTVDEYLRIKEDSLTITNGGDIQFTMTNNEASFQLLAYVYKTNAADVVTGFALPQTTSAITATMGESLFPYFSCYSIKTVGAAITKTRVYPSNISLNSNNNLAYLSFINQDDIYTVSFSGVGDFVNLVDHGFVAGTPIKFATTAGGVTAGTVYYVLATGLTTSQFKISTSPSGTAENLSTTASIQMFASLNLSINWDYADSVHGTYCVSPAVTSADGYVDNQVQMTIWGLPHSNLYGGAPSGSAPGWVNHLDTYRAQAEERAVCGLGGNLFAAYTGTELQMPTYFPSLRARSSGYTVIAPTLIGTSDTGLRTNGWIQFEGGETNQAQVVSVIYNPITGWVDYTLATPSWSASSSLSSIVTNQDYLTATNMGYPIHAGEFLIRDIYALDSDRIVISVLNPSVEIGDWNDIDSGGKAGLFCDSIPLDRAVPFIKGDRILSIDWGEEQFLEATDTSSGTQLNLKGLYEPVTVADGLLLAGRRSGYVMPIRELNANRTTYQMVPGDIIRYNDLVRELRVKSVNAIADQTVTITASNGVATVAIADSTWLNVGQRILLVNSGSFTGEQVVTSIPDKHSFTFDTSSTGSVGAATLQGYYLELDEQLDWSDTTDNLYSLQIARRWIPVEAPQTGYPLVNQNRFRYLNANPYDSQPMLRSTMVQDTLYLTNGDDAVQRFDGTSLSRAGLIRWQAGLFLTTDTTASATIKLNNYTLASTNILGVNANVLTVTNGKEKFFTAGERVRLVSVTSGVTTTTDYTISEPPYSHDNPAQGFIPLDAKTEIILGDTNTLNQLSVFRYYFRLNLYDVNDNRIVTGATNAQDYVITLHDSSAIHMTLLRPAWIDNYDYSRIDLQIYRTKADESTNFYQVATLKPYWVNSAQAYIQYTDVTSDDSLTELDSTLSTLAGIGLGQTWTGPLRAKYVTSGSNRLVLGNIRSWPSINLTMSDTGSVIQASSLTGLTWLLRKDNLDSLTTTDNLNRMQFEFLDSGAVSFTPNTALAIDVESGLVTYTDGAHGLLNAGDWFYLFRDSQVNGALTRLGGWYQVVERLSSTQFTFQIDQVLAAKIGSTPTSLDVNRLVHATDPKDVPVWLGTDGLYSMINSQTSTLLGARLVSMRRFASAVNAVQNVCSTTGFKPWVIAYAGGEYAPGQIIFETPYVSDSTLELVLPNYRGFNLFVNGGLVPARQSVQAVSQRFPSRLIMSYANYPELFDSPTAYSDTESESAIDVNSADGQEITGIIPFFGEAAFGAAQKDAILLVFKTASVYLINLAEKAAGRNAVQKLDTRGLGCTAPFSIAPTQNGIMFANQSGIYRITTGLEMQYIGRRMERVWKEEVDTSDVSNTYGHYSALENKYKLSIPMKDSQVKYPTSALVYNTVREYTADGYRDGSWTVYDSMPSIGWVNLLTRSLFASPHGEVFTIRNTNTATDYRDDGAPITAEATLRALDFGSSGIRKTVSTFILQFRTAIAPEQVVVESAINLLDQWEALDPATVKGRQQDSLSTVDTPRVAVIRFTSNRRKGVFFQLRVKNSNYDEGMDLLGGSVLVAALGPQGTVEAADT
jgi:hypothetical protein